MNGYNSNYFNRQLVNSMKTALTQVLSENKKKPQDIQPNPKDPSTWATQQVNEFEPPLGYDESGDFFRKGWADATRKDPKTGRPAQQMSTGETEGSYAERTYTGGKRKLEAELRNYGSKSEKGKKAAAALKRLETSYAAYKNPKPTATAPTTPPAPSGGSKSAIPSKQEIDKSQEVANRTGVPTALPTNVTPGTVGITDLDGFPISVSPQTPPKREMSPINTGQNFQQRFGIKIPIVQVTNQMNQFAKAEKEKQAQIDSGQGAYSPTDKASAERGEQSDWSSGYDNSPIGLLGLGSFKYGGKSIPNQSSIPPSVTPTQTAPTPVDIPDDIEAAKRYEARVRLTQGQKAKQKKAEPSLTQKFLDIFREPEKQSKPNRFSVKTNNSLYRNLPS